MPSKSLLGTVGRRYCSVASSGTQTTSQLASRLGTSGGAHRAEQAQAVRELA